MEFNKKNAKKIKNATQEELGKLEKEYEAVKKNVNGMSLAGLMIIAIAGIVMILIFQNKLLVIIGLVMLLYPIYVFIRRGAHREGYFEGYYDMMKEFSSRVENATHDAPKGTDSKKPAEKK